MTTSNTRSGFPGPSRPRRNCGGPRVEVRAGPPGTDGIPPSGSSRRNISVTTGTKLEGDDQWSPMVNEWPITAIRWGGPCSPHLSGIRAAHPPPSARSSFRQDPSSSRIPEVLLAPVPVLAQGDLPFGGGPRRRGRHSSSAPAPGPRPGRSASVAGQAELPEVNGGRPGRCRSGKSSWKPVAVALQPPGSSWSRFGDGRGTLRAGGLRPGRRARWRRTVDGQRPPGIDTFRGEQRLEVAPSGSKDDGSPLGPGPGTTAGSSLRRRGPHGPRARAAARLSGRERAPGGIAGRGRPLPSFPGQQGPGRPWVAAMFASMDRPSRRAVASPQRRPCPRAPAGRPGPGPRQTLPSVGSST